ncbi:LacI family DNA-binding transcriptional regulator [Streptomyces fuscigenes]|uniref:LacI family DNA-binding transcriptional regulator n=1 Tax=Streptomyces fuscigenes TaxID=1528880 RepID=UPI001F368709|nr:LacI family DNA-binding transcriptional regulator [Streptomyces fuscigenes]MCF3962068.1 LacI family transcriptional regulator [Streptomyces fuscigenes]
MRSVRLSDVARHAGVSTKTVSNVVHGYQHVRPSTRERVQRAIAELGYRPDARGRSLATGRTHMLALAVPDLRNPYFAELAHSIAEAAIARGYRLLLEESMGTPEVERAVLSAEEAGLVDGLIFQPVWLTSGELAQHSRGVPVVLLGENSAPLSMDHVRTDNVAAAAHVVEHLHALGRRRIAFLGAEAPVPSQTSKLRLMGYQKGLEACGLPVDPALVVTGGAADAARACAALGAALDAGLAPDALLCRDDLAALGALRALGERGLRVPEDVALTGWDDIEAATHVRPSITTVRADAAHLAGRALDLLFERIEGYDGLGRHEFIGHSLQVRESAPAAKR